MPLLVRCAIKTSVDSMPFVQIDQLDVGLVEARERAQRAHDVAHARARQPRHLREILDRRQIALLDAAHAHAREDAQEEIVVVHDGGRAAC